MAETKSRTGGDKAEGDSWGKQFGQRSRNRERVIVSEPSLSIFVDTGAVDYPEPLETEQDQGRCYLAVSCHCQASR